ncbi:RNA polymerase sigma factor [Pedobacter frigidisoli]|uniref:RNA polymerase sigma factor n=1 Tax=Pedobacter frigidisoli TaxID=2530455 RepID=A0A4R0NZG2_9SPHI|nr:RNA polymerase sigma factor [Pedobacter frigidisoli]TCD04561.1 RNA polymerase sigma factor [Pedobacter frigidisoli]
MLETEQFIGILNEHKRLLYKVTYSYCRNLDDRKDLEQEIIIQLWKSFKNYKQEFKLSTWIYKIALNVAISHYRRDVKRKETNEPYDDAVFQISEEENCTEEDIYKTQLLYKFINKLDELNKAIIILYLEDKSYKEISEIIGLTETNVGTKINRIKRKLKESISLLND